MLRVTALMEKVFNADVETDMICRVSVLRPNMTCIYGLDGGLVMNLPSAQSER